MKIGFSIIVYDKYYEVKLLADLLKGMDKNFYVLVCTNKTGAGKEFEGYPNIDEVIENEDLPFRKGMPLEDMHMRMRVGSNISRANMELIKHKDLDYCVFLHSDSWVLDKKAILKIISDMRKKDRQIAVRGTGFSIMFRECPYGIVEDMFIFYERKFAEERRLWDWDVLEQLPHIHDSHGMVSINLLIKGGLSHIYFYNNSSEVYFWKTKWLTEKNKNFRFHNPIFTNFSPEHKICHTHEGMYPGTLGKSLQAYYLAEFGHTKGPTIEPFLKEYWMEPKELFTQIKEVDRKTLRRLHRHGLNYEILGVGKHFTKVNGLLDQPLWKKVKLLVSCWIRYFIGVKLITRERYYWYFYGAPLKEGLAQYYQNRIIDEEYFKKHGHRLWYKEKYD